MKDYVMNEVEVKRENDVDVDGREQGGIDENVGSDQEIVVGIDEDHINFLTSMASGDDDSLDGTEPGTGDGLIAGEGHAGEEDEDIMATAKSILSKTAERTNQAIYHCKFCNKTFTWLKSLTVHLRTHTNVKPYKCELCDRSFVRSDYLKYHIMKSHETTEQVFTCNACSGVFATNRGLLRHIRAEHDVNVERKGMFSNAECPSDSEMYGEMDENGKFSCTYCDLSYDERDSLVHHMKRHLGEKPFVCDLCPKSFIRQDFLQCHRSNHLKTLDYKQNGFPMESEQSKRPRISLKKLEDLVQSNSVSRAESSDDEARDGGASSSDSDHQEEHRDKADDSEEQKSLLASLLTQVSKTENNRFQCPRCDKTFSGEDTLKTHLRTHTVVTPFKCPLCSLAFIRSDYLKIHLRKHIEDNGEDPGAPGAIDTASLPFSSTSLGNAVISATSPSISLLKPLNDRPISTNRISLLKPPEERKPPEQPEYCIRTDDGKFMCTACERVFSHQQTVRIHYRIHTNEKPYKCTFCPESFIRSDYLERHMKVHWKDSPSMLQPVVGKPVLPLAGTSDSSDSTSPQKLTIGRAGLMPENYHFVEAGDGQYACKICDQVFSHSDSLRKHALTHTEEKPFFCDVCDRSFNRVDYLKEHFKSKRHRQAVAEATGDVVDDDEDSMTESSFSGRMIKTKSPISPLTNALADRIEFQRTEDGRYKCSECDKTFVTAVTLKMHLRLHTGEKPYKCNKCSMAFIRSDYLKTHEKVHRQGAYMNSQVGFMENTVSGDETDEERAQPIKQESDANGLVEVKKDPDEIGGYGDAENYEDQEEEEEDSEDEQVIEVMVKEEDSDDDDEEEEQEREEQDERNDEELEEEGENNNSYENEDNANNVGGASAEPAGPKSSKHRCNICKKQFAWPKSLKIHLRTHTGERPYECDVCGKSFTRSDSLKAHRNTHGDVRVLQCHLCDDSFLNGRDLIRHQKLAHGLEPLDV